MKLSSQTPLQLLFRSSSILNKLEEARSGKINSSSSYYMLIISPNSPNENLFYIVLDLSSAGDITMTVMISFPPSLIPSLRAVLCIEQKCYRSRNNTDNVSVFFKRS